MTGTKKPFGQVIVALRQQSPAGRGRAGESTGRDLGWPYCNPDQDENHPAGSLANIPLVPDALTNPRGRHLNCATVPRIEVGLPAHSAPLGIVVPHRQPGLPAPWSGRQPLSRRTGSWDREPPEGPQAVLWLRWNAARQTLEPAITMVSGFQEPDGSRWGRAGRRGGRAGRRPVRQRRHRRRHLPVGPRELLVVRGVVVDVRGGVLDVRGVVLDVGEALTCLGFVGARD